MRKDNKATEAGQFRLLWAALAISLSLHALLLLLEAPALKFADKRSQRILLGLRLTPQPQSPPAARPSVQKASPPKPVPVKTSPPPESRRRPTQTEAPRNTPSEPVAETVRPPEPLAEIRSPLPLKRVEKTAEAQTQTALNTDRNPRKSSEPTPRTEVSAASPAPMTVTPLPSKAPRPYPKSPEPLYPDNARRRGWQGEVILVMGVNAEGRVSKIAVERSSGYPALDRSALQQVRRWAFHPATENGAPVAGQVRVPIRFQLN